MGPWIPIRLLSSRVRAAAAPWSTATAPITYTPGTALGDVAFTYTVEDNLGSVSNAATVTVFVNAPPVAANDTAMTGDATAITIAVLANDDDPDGTLNVSTVTVVSVPASGNGQW